MTSFIYNYGFWLYLLLKLIKKLKKQILWDVDVKKENQHQLNQNQNQILVVVINLPNQNLNS